ncbi:MAG: AEC family transporter [Anaerolineales bacterium]
MIGDLFKLFLENLFPIFLIAGLGYLLGKWLKVQPEPLSKVVFYVFAPFLLFDLLTTNHLSDGDFIRMMGFATLNIIIIGSLSWVIAEIIKLERRLLVAVLLTTMLVNAGNFGLSLSFFAFGELGLSHASIFFVTSAILTYTLGVTIASMGTTNLQQAFIGLLKIPAIYAVALAFGFIIFGWKLPTPLERTTNLMANAAIPALLVVLGLQLHHRDRIKHIKALSLALSMRLLVAPLLALGLSVLLDLQGVAQQAGVIEAAMPTAVMSTVLATEYDVEPGFVTTTVFLSTILSPITLTPLLSYLGA